MKFVFGLPVAFAAEQRAIVGELELKREAVSWQRETFVVLWSYARERILNLV